METFIKRYIVERTNKADIRLEEQSEKAERYWEKLWKSSFLFTSLSDANYAIKKMSKRSRPFVNCDKTSNQTQSVMDSTVCKCQLCYQMTKSLASPQRAELTSES